MLDISTDGKLWFKYAVKITGDKYKAEDLVPEMYLTVTALFKRYPKKELSKSYIFKTLKTIYLKQIETDSKPIQFDIQESEDDLPFDEVGLLEQVQNRNDATSFNIYHGVMDFLNTINSIDDWFHNTVFKLVIVGGMSLRELAKQSGIHFNILQSSIVITKTKLQKIYNDDYVRIKKT